MTQSAKSVVTYWDPEGFQGSYTNIYTTGALSGNWESPFWSTSSSGTVTTISWIENTAACFAVGAGATNSGIPSSTTTFNITMNVDHVVGGFFDGILNPNACIVSFNGPGSVILPVGLQSMYSINATDGSTGQLIFNIPVTGIGVPTFQGNGKFFLNMRNTYTGGTLLGYSGASFRGFINFNTDSCFGTGNIVVQNTAAQIASLVWSGGTNVSITNAVIWTGNTNAVDLVAPSGILTFTGPWILGNYTNRSIGVSANAVTIAGKLSGGGGFTKFNSGTLILGNGNSYSGGTTVQAGVLEAASDGALGSGTVRVFDGATLMLSGGSANQYISSSSDLLMSGSSSVVDLAFSGSDTVHAISFDNGLTFQPIGTYGAVGSGATFQSAHFTGTGTLIVAAISGSVPPSIAFTCQPQDVTASQGVGASFSVCVSNVTSPTFQWMWNGVPIVGATNATLLINAQTTNAGAYFVEVTGPAGLRVSQAAVLTVNAASPSAQTSPASALTTTSAQLNGLINGNGLTTSAYFDYGPDLRYGYKTVPIFYSGASQNISHTITGLRPGTTYHYRLTVSNSVARNLGPDLTFTTSGSSLPMILYQPEPQSAKVSNDARFNVEALGSSPLNYQWRKGGANISGATTSILTLNSIGTSDVEAYSAVVSNPYGSATSDAVLLTVYSPLTLTQTNRVPTTEIGLTTVPASATNFTIFTNNIFTAGVALNPNKPTVVMTHGWNSAPSYWPLLMAYNVQHRLGINAVNLVAWDWSADASSSPFDLGKKAAITPGQGLALGTSLVSQLGTGYSKPIHFVGHSLGTLVNAAAANYIHTHGYSWTNTQMTLCDDAEIAWAFQGNRIVGFFSTVGAAGLLGLDSANSQPWWGDTLPHQFLWADNYIAFCGLLHPNAANAVLTWNSPQNSSDLGYLLQEYYDFHDYAHEFYGDTIEPSVYNTGGATDPTYLGFVSSFEGGGAAQRQPVNTYFYQPPPTQAFELNLVKTNYAFANDTLQKRLGQYLDQWKDSAEDWAIDSTASTLGNVTGRIETGAHNTLNAVWNLITAGPGSSKLSPLSPRIPTVGTNTPAYIWSRFSVPPNAFAMSFDFMLQGDGKLDLFEAALNGTNIFSAETALIATNAFLNSGTLDVTPYAGQTVEFFLGIVGGTSTNANMTISNIQFQAIAPPSLQATASGNVMTLSWPFTATGYTLEATDNLGQSNAWTVVTNVPVVVGFQNTITNSASPSVRFYRLRK